MPRIGGVPENKSRILGGVAESIILYVAPAWTYCLKYRKYRDVLLKEQRKVLIRITRAYRTVSNEALAVIAGITPKLKREPHHLGKQKKKRNQQKKKYKTDGKRDRTRQKSTMDKDTYQKYRAMVKQELWRNQLPPYQNTYGTQLFWRISIPIELEEEQVQDVMIAKMEMTHQDIQYLNAGYYGYKKGRV